VETKRREEFDFLHSVSVGKAEFLAAESERKKQKYLWAFGRPLTMRPNRSQKIVKM
jgi:hypothetical protein